MKLARDKVLHLVVGAAIAFGAVLVTSTPVFGLLAAVIAGVGKELWDRHQNARAARNHVVPPHSVEWQDAAWTAVGGAVVAGLTHLGGL